MKIKFGNICHLSAFSLRIFMGSSQVISGQLFTISISTQTSIQELKNKKSTLLQKHLDLEGLLLPDLTSCFHRFLDQTTLILLATKLNLKKLNTKRSISFAKDLLYISLVDLGLFITVRRTIKLSIKDIISRYQQLPCIQTSL